MNNGNTTRPCAKINLGLYITEKRPDGYHNLETVFYPIPLCDTLRISEDDEDKLLLSGIPVAGNTADNLVMRALKLLREECFIPPLCISLDKQIPSGAGLGGGSSDAASMMKMLNEHFKIGLTDTDIEKRVSTLGADCAFFVKSSPTLAEGIGNIFSPISLSLKGWHLVLVKPDEFVSTKEAYSMIKPKRPAFDLRETIALPVEEWKDKLFNDFEYSVFKNHPIIRDIKGKLYDMGASYACMSGSGSSVFGLFREAPHHVDKVFHNHFTFTSVLE